MIHSHGTVLVLSANSYFKNCIYSSNISSKNVWERHLLFLCLHIIPGHLPLLFLMSTLIANWEISLLACRLGIVSPAVLFGVQIQSSDSHASQLWSELILHSISLQRNESWSRATGINWKILHLYTKRVPLSGAFHGRKAFSAIWSAIAISGHH